MAKNNKSLRLMILIGGFNKTLQIAIHTSKNAPGMQIHFLSQLVSIILINYHNYLNKLRYVLVVVFAYCTGSYHSTVFQSMWLRFSVAHCSSQHLRLSIDASSTHVVLIEDAHGYQRFVKTTRYTLSTRRRSSGKSVSPLSWLTW